MAVASCGIAPADFAAARAAAEWARAFHPGVTVMLDREAAQLTSAGHSEAELRAIWRTCFLNEKLLALGAEKRGAVLTELVR